METNLNGIIIDGKVYEAIPANGEESCKGCPSFQGRGCSLAKYCTIFDDSFIRFSPELTEKLKGE